MKKIPACVFAILLATLFCLPAVAAPAQTASPGLTALPSAIPEVLLVQNGPPADFPARGTPAESRRRSSRNPASAR